jgi:hypothetical protein
MLCCDCASPQELFLSNNRRPSRTSRIEVVAVSCARLPRAAAIRELRARVQYLEETSRFRRARATRASGAFLRGSIIFPEYRCGLSRGPDLPLRVLAYPYSKKAGRQATANVRMDDSMPGTAPVTYVEPSVAANFAGLLKSPFLIS